MGYVIQFRPPRHVRVRVVAPRTRAHTYAYVYGRGLKSFKMSAGESGVRTVGVTLILVVCWCLLASLMCKVNRI